MKTVFTSISFPGAEQSFDLSKRQPPGSRAFEGDAGSQFSEAKGMSSLRDRTPVRPEQCE